MNTATSVIKFSEKMDTLARDLPDATRLGVNRCARMAQESALKTLAVATGGDLRLSGTKKSRIGVKVEEQSEHAASIAAIVRGVPGGLTSWMESGTKKHVIGAGRGGVGISTSKTGRVFAEVQRRNGSTRRSYKRKIIHFKAKTPPMFNGTKNGRDGRFRAGPFMGGGVRPKYGFSAGINLVADLFPETIDAEYGRLLRGVFHG